MLMSFLSACATKVKYIPSDVGLCLDPPKMKVRETTEPLLIQNAFIVNRWIDLVCEETDG